MKAFAAIVERASFTRAAEQLGLSPSALSQTIRQLETRLGVRLLNRTTRSVAPTAAGSRLYERIAPMILELDAAVSEAVASAGRTVGTLRINTLGMAAKKVKRILADWSPMRPGLYLYYSNRRHAQPVLRAFIDCLLGREEAGSRRRGRTFTINRRTAA